MSASILRRQLIRHVRARPSIEYVENVYSILAAAYWSRLFSVSEPSFLSRLISSVNHVHCIDTCHLEKSQRSSTMTILLTPARSPTCIEGQRRIRWKGVWIGIGWIGISSRGIELFVGGHMMKIVRMRNEVGILLRIDSIDRLLLMVMMGIDEINEPVCLKVLLVRKW